MKWADWRHIYDFSFDQFHPRAGTQYTRFRHAVIFFHIETMFCLNPHTDQIIESHGHLQPEPGRGLCHVFVTTA